MSILRVDIHHTNKHTDCKNLKEFACIAIDVAFKCSRDRVRDQGVQLWSIGDKQAPIPCQQSPSSHNEQTQREIEHAPMYCATAYNQTEEPCDNRKKEVELEFDSQGPERSIKLLGESIIHAKG